MRNISLSLCHLYLQFYIHHLSTSWSYLTRLCTINIYHFTYCISVISVIYLPIHVVFFLEISNWLRTLFQYECVSHSCKIPAQAGVFCDWILSTLSGHCGRFCDDLPRLWNEAEQVEGLEMSLREASLRMAFRHLMNVLLADGQMRTASPSSWRDHGKEEAHFPF